ERMIEKVVKEFHQEESLLSLKASYQNTNWRLWQLKLIEYMQKDPDARKILWYVDEKGNSGKTYVTKWLLTEGDTFRFENGKSADVKFAYEGQKNVVFDLSRSQESHVNYEVIESVKNGVVFSTKYESKMKVFKTPHVVIMANFAPDESKMSADRWDIRYLNDDD
ncbi:Para-Rep C1, partial [Lamellibrachia satsuma]